MRRLEVLLVATIVIASCGGGGTKGSNVKPGHDSPQAALTGFMTGISHHQPGQACGYVTPDEGTGCAAALGAASITVDDWKLGNSFTNGNQALVTIIVKKLCIDQKCYSNADPNADLPQDSQGFAAAWAGATASGNTSPLAPIDQTDGKWYVVLT